MKLRVRLAGAPDVPFLRVDVAPSQTVAELSALCSAHFGERLLVEGGAPAPAPLLTFSLNKRDALLLGGDGTAPVSALGVTGGDLLWIMDACKQAAPPTATTAAVTATTATAAAADQPMQAAPPAAAAAEEQEQARREEADEQEEEEEHVPAPAEPLLPAHLRRALLEAGPPLAALLAPAGASPPSARAAPAALLAAAVHAAMLEAGFEPAGDACDGGDGMGQGPPSEGAVPGHNGRSRRLYGHGAGAGDVSYPPVSGAGGGAELSAARAAEGVRVEVRCAPLGGASVLVAGAVARRSAAAAARGGAAAEGATAAAPAAAASTAVVTLALGVAEHVCEAVGEEAEEDDEEMEEGEGKGRGRGAGGHHQRRHRFRSVPSLWRALKDGLCSPLLAAHHRAAGLPPPAGLLALPLDLIVREVLPRVVLEGGGVDEAAAVVAAEEAAAPTGAFPAASAGAGARALASCCLACSALRAAASADELWRPIFEAESRAGGRRDPSEPSLRLAAERRGWKWAAAALAGERRRRERLARLRHRPLARPPPPWPLGPRPPTFFPRPPGFGGAPGVIGGDYDRLPGGGAGRGGAGGGGAFGGSGGFFFAHGGGGGGGLGAAGSAMPGPAAAPGPFAMPGFVGLRRGGGGGGGGGGRDFSLRH